MQRQDILDTRWEEDAIQGTPQMAADKEAISFSRVHKIKYYSYCNLPLFYASPSHKGVFFHDYIMKLKYVLPSESVQRRW